MEIRVKRAYDEPAADDGTRVLVDRVWPRGVSKQKAALDDWNKDVAPSTELRTWYGHDPDKYDEFRSRYLAELDDEDHREALDRLRTCPKGRRLTLVTATKDVAHSQAAVLADVLR